jgi:hypothetical protein
MTKRRREFYFDVLAGATIAMLIIFITGAICLALALVGSDVGWLILGGWSVIVSVAGTLIVRVIWNYIATKTN